MIDTIIKEHTKYINLHHNSKQLIENYTLNSKKMRLETPDDLSKLNSLIFYGPSFENNPIDLYYMVDPNYIVQTKNNQSKPYYQLKENDVFTPFSIDNHKNYTCVMSTTYDFNYSLYIFSPEFDDDKNNLETMFITKPWNYIQHIMNRSILTKNYSDKIEIELQKFYPIERTKSNFSLNFINTKTIPEIEQGQKIFCHMYYKNLCCGLLVYIKNYKGKGLCIEEFSKYSYQHEVVLPCKKYFRVCTIDTINYNVRNNLVPVKRMIIESI